MDEEEEEHEQNVFEQLFNRKEKTIRVERRIVDFSWYQISQRVRTLLNDNDSKIKEPDS